MITNAPVSRSGRFAERPAAAVAKFTESISYDWRLWRQDILGSVAHATMLQRVGLISAREKTDIVKGLEAIGKEIASGQFRWKLELEDVHMNIEAELTRRVPAGAKLHTGRSRNDQIALDTRMWLRDEITGLLLEIQTLQRALLALADKSADVIIPGYTHLQRAQPVSLAHHLLAYVEMFERDYQRLRDCFQRVNICPLGSGAIAGSTLPLDRHLVAKLLGFTDIQGKPLITQNSMDAVSDRDFAVEFCSDAALIAVHLSRLAEDIILWGSTEFNFIKIADAYTTGSSLMPQKKNPDVAELTRGKTGRVIGNLMALLTLLKGLPMTYNRDLQEDKEQLFDSAHTVRTTVQIVASMLANISINELACAAAASDPLLLATDLADYFVRRGMPFRHAHHVVGALVAVADQLGKPLNKMTLAEFRSVEKNVDQDVYELFDLKRALGRRNSIGAPGSLEVKKQLERWHKSLAEAKPKPTRGAQQKSKTRLGSRS